MDKVRPHKEKDSKGKDKQKDKDEDKDRGGDKNTNKSGSINPPMVLTAEQVTRCGVILILGYDLALYEIVRQVVKKDGIPTEQSPTHELYKLSHFFAHLLVHSINHLSRVLASPLIYCSSPSLSATYSITPFLNVCARVSHGAFCACCACTHACVFVHAALSTASTTWSPNCCASTA